MTAPAIWPGTELDSITFSGEEKRPGCDARECQSEALYEATYKTVGEVPCRHDRARYCLAHKDQVMADAPGPFFCRDCPGSESELMRMEPIR